MVNTVPIVGRNAYIKIGSAQVGYCRGVTADLKRTSIKDYVMSTNEPAVLETGNITYTITIDKLWIDSTNAAALRAGTKLSLEIGPEGSSPSSAESKFTFSNCVVTDSGFKWTADGVVGGNISMEAKTLVISSY